MRIRLNYDMTLGKSISGRASEEAQNSKGLNVCAELPERLVSGSRLLVGKTGR